MIIVLNMISDVLEIKGHIHKNNEIFELCMHKNESNSWIAEAMTRRLHFVVYDFEFYWTL